MKILILQLARLGDIYQTWPVVRALRRMHGTLAQIDIVTRDRFSGATIGLEEVNEVYRLDSKKILSEVFCDQPQVQNTADELDRFVASIRANSYDRIINLSFSTFSSYLAEALCSENTRVTGYSRFDDGFLNIPDEVSSYFFAQVGVGLSNRIHVTDLFAQVAEVELIPPDYTNNFGSPQPDRKNRILIHIGASAAHKRLTPMKWQGLISALVKTYTGQVCLIGAGEEFSIAEDILKVVQSEKVINLVGQTKLDEVLKLISESELLIGADSAPMHMASLVQTPVLNLSFETVNFWETGPKSPRSQIVRMTSESDLTTAHFIASVESILFGEDPPRENILVESAVAPYQTREEDSFGWDMAQSIYMGRDLPYVSDVVLKQALLRLYEANQLAIEQVGYLQKDSTNKVAVSSFEQCDLIFATIEKLCPDVGVLVRWIRAEKLRIPPGNYSEVLAKFETVHSALTRVIKSYPIENWYQLKNGVLNDKNILDEA